jgi:hypothetical protein
LEGEKAFGPLISGREPGLDRAAIADAQDKLAGRGVLVSKVDAGRHFVIAGDEESLAPFGAHACRLTGPKKKRPSGMLPASAANPSVNSQDTTPSSPVA